MLGEEKAHLSYIVNTMVASALPTEGAAVPLTKFGLNIPFKKPGAEITKAQFINSSVRDVFHFALISCDILSITFIFDRVHCIYSVVTSSKYERDNQLKTHLNDISVKSKERVELA